MKNITGIFNKMFNREIKNPSPEQHYKHNVYTSEISQYSPLPRFYFIKGVQYDIDSPESVSMIPTCETHFNINDEDWGIDTILREHVNRYYSFIPDDLKAACYSKISDLKSAGFEKESLAEKKARISQEKAESEKEHELRSITLSDMEQFHFSNFKMENPIYDNKKSIIMITEQNQIQVKKDIELINSYVADMCQTLGINVPLCIDPSTLKFDTELLSDFNLKQYFTFFECNPYTKTGKLSKYPLILHYATPAYTDFNPTQNFFGTISYMQDGNIGKCKLTYWLNNIMYFFDFGLKGKTLSAKKVEKHEKDIITILYKA